MSNPLSERIRARTRPVSYTDDPHGPSLADEVAALEAERDALRRKLAEALAEPTTDEIAAALATSLSVIASRRKRLMGEQ